jgi:hypothetical protein
MHPTHPCRQNRTVFGLEAVVARAEDIGHLPLVDEDSRLPWPDDQLRTPLDLVSIPRETPHQSVLAVVDPFSDVDKLRAKFVEECHL